MVRANYGHRAPCGSTVSAKQPDHSRCGRGRGRRRGEQQTSSGCACTHEATELLGGAHWPGHRPPAAKLGPRPTPKGVARGPRATFVRSNLEKEVKLDQPDQHIHLTRAAEPPGAAALNICGHQAIASARKVSKAASPVEVSTVLPAQRAVGRQELGRREVFFPSDPVRGKGRRCWGKKKCCATYLCAARSGTPQTRKLRRQFTAGPSKREGGCRKTVLPAA